MNDPELEDAALVAGARRPEARTGGGWGAALAWVLGGLFFALIGLTIAGRELRGPPAWVTLGVTMLPYLYAAFAVVCFSAWTLLPDRRDIPGLMAAVCVAGVGLWGPTWSAFGAQYAGSEQEVVTVMSWNLRRLWGGPDDGGDPVRCAVRGIRDANPDVIAMQEVSANDVARLSHELGLKCTHTPYKNSRSPKHGGLATCTRGNRWTLTSGRALRFVDSEDWYYVFSEFEREGRVFNLLAVHLTPYAYAAKGMRTSELTQPEKIRQLHRFGAEVVKGQGNQAVALLRQMDKLSDPTIVAGDFNSTRDASLHTRLRRRLTDTWEAGGLGMGGTVSFLRFASLRVDFIYASKSFGVLGAEVGSSGCSDHHPVVSRLAL